MIMRKPITLCAVFALLPSVSYSFSSPGVSSPGVFFSSPNKISSCAAAANDGDLFFDESSSDQDISSASSEELSPASSSKVPSQFAEGSKLQRIRIDLESYRENLKWAQAINDTKRIGSLRKAIEETEQMDPEIVYKKALFLIAEAKSSSSQPMEKDLQEKLIQHWEEQAQVARSYLPKFQMDGVSASASTM
jgi:hypothetical protein